MVTVIVAGYAVQVRGKHVIHYMVCHFLYYFYKTFSEVNPVRNTWYDKFGMRYVRLLRKLGNYGYSSFTFCVKCPGLKLPAIL